MPNTGTIEVAVSLYGGLAGPTLLRFPTTVPDAQIVRYDNFTFAPGANNFAVQPGTQFFCLIPPAGNTITFTVNTLTVDPAQPVLLAIDPNNTTLVVVNMTGGVMVGATILMW